MTFWLTKCKQGTSSSTSQRRFYPWHFWMDFVAGRYGCIWLASGLPTRCVYTIENAWAGYNKVSFLSFFGLALCCHVSIWHFALIFPHETILAFLTVNQPIISYRWMKPHHQATFAPLFVWFVNCKKHIAHSKIKASILKSPLFEFYYYLYLYGTLHFETIW